MSRCPEERLASTRIVVVRGDIAMVRAITFDMDDTLQQVHPFPPQLRFMELCGASGIPLSHEQALVAVRARKLLQEERKAQGGRATPEWSQRYWRMGLEAAGATGDLDQLTAALVDARRRMPPRVVLDPDVPDVLEHLRARGFLLGVVSNWGTALAGALEAYGIAHYFTCIMDSDTAGVIKPDPALYLAACARLRVSPAECLHVGDSPSHDVGMALAAGAAAALYDPLDTLDAGCPRVHRLLDLSGLL